MHFHASTNQQNNISLRNEYNPAIYFLQFSLSNWHYSSIVHWSNNVMVSMYRSPLSDSFPLNLPPLYCKLQWGNPANIWFCLNLSLGGPIDLKVDTSELHFGCSFKVHPNNNGYTCVYVCNVYRHWCTLVGGQYCFNGYTCVILIQESNVHRHCGVQCTSEAGQRQDWRSFSWTWDLSPSSIVSTSQAINIF